GALLEIFHSDSFAQNWQGFYHRTDFNSEGFSMAARVEGVCAQAFMPVQEAFETLMQNPAERGASVALYHQGELKVNLWAGTRDKARTLPWQQDTLVNVFSTSKGIAA